MKNHIRNILEKLHLHSRMEAVVYAVREKLLEITWAALRCVRDRAVPAATSRRCSWRAWRTRASRFVFGLPGEENLD